MNRFESFEEKIESRLCNIEKNVRSMLENQNKIGQKLIRIETVINSGASQQINVLADDEGILHWGGPCSSTATPSSSFNLGAPPPPSTTGKPVTPHKIKTALNPQIIGRIKECACSRMNFVKNLFFKIYDYPHLANKNVNGTHGKEGLDPDVVTYIRYLAFHEFPLDAGEDASEKWKECVTATNRGISDRQTK